MSLAQASLAQAQEILDRKFKNGELLRQALTKGAAHQRLEFLGDKILGLLAATSLWRNYDSAREGELSLRFYRLTDSRILLKIAAENHLEQLVMAGGFGGKRAAADLLEALLAAVYLDGGMAAAQRSFSKMWGEYLKVPLPPLPPKSALQEWSQARNLGLPDYEITAVTDAKLSPRFVAKVAVSGETACGKGASKAEASAEAAAKLLRKLARK